MAIRIRDLDTNADLYRNTCLGGGIDIVLLSQCFSLVIRAYIISTSEHGVAKCCRLNIEGKKSCSLLRRLVAGWEWRRQHRASDLGHN